MSWLASLAGAVSAAASALLTGGPVATDPLLCRLSDPRIVESSGVAVAGELLLTHNDSDERARFFALDRRCRTVATYALSGVGVRDWEDMARGAGALWFGDIGDNQGRRTEIVVHRVAEPAGGLPTGEGTRAVTSTAHRLRYDDGPHDAEALLVHPGTGRLLVVTKSYAGAAGVYAAPPPSPGTVGTLRRVATVRLRPSGSPGGPAGALGQVAVTGGDINGDASRLVLRTYTDAYEWQVRGGDVVAALAAAPTRVALPATAQGEAIAYDTDGKSWLTTTEGSGGAVHRLPR